MNIEELEFIRDFSEFIWNLETDMSRVILSIDSADQDEKITEVSFDHCSALSSISNQIKLLQRIFNDFKKVCDKKYWNEWKIKYPHISEEFKDG